jgi:glycosyltransferase involved in cell wall biosynthesis
VSRKPRVLAIPGHLAYVRNLGIHSTPAIGYSYRLPDRLADIPLGSVDVLHFHTVELFRLDELANILAVAATLGKRIVLTVHDLVPNIEQDLDGFLRKLRLVARSADAVVTLTEVAAERLHMIVGPRTAITVLPHGSALPLEVLRETPGAAGGDAWVSFGALRPNRDVVALVRAWGVQPRASRRPLRVLLRSVSVEDERRYRPILDYLRNVSEVEDDFALVVRRDFVDAVELVNWLRPAGLMVLPYSRITHSGQLELARDLGLPAVAPDVDTLRAQTAVGPAIPRVRWFSPDELRNPQRFIRVLQRALQLTRSGADELRSFRDYRVQEHAMLVQQYRAVLTPSEP